MYSRKVKACVIVFSIFLLLFSASVSASHAKSIMTMRVSGFNPATNEYNFTCTPPPSRPGSMISQDIFYAIDPVPSYHYNNRTFRSTSGNISWHLDPINYDELVHTKAMYHVYCEVQNFSAPPGQQNIATEIHVDLRTTENSDVPNIYVLSSEGRSATLKCEPPEGVKRFSIAWTLRNRAGTTALPGLNDMQIVNVTVPKASSDWDVVCTVFDKDRGVSSRWDMPIEFFEEGEAYVPTIEGCIPGDPCFYISSNGIPPNGALTLTVSANSTGTNANIYINEVFKGTTSSSGAITINNIKPGLHNLVIRKTGYEELSTLIPIASGKTLTRKYDLSTNTSTTQTNSCHSTVFSLPATCTGGSITFDDAASGCRVVECGSSSGSLRVMACNKPGNTNAQYFEMYRQGGSGSAPKLCLGTACMQTEGFVKSSNFPMCTGNVSQPVASNGTLNVGSNPNFVDLYLNGVFKATTTQNGQAVINNIAPGTYTLLASKTGYSSNTTQVTITSGQIVDVFVKLNAASNQSNTTTPPNNTTQNQTIQVCKSSLADIPATCNGGTITQDSMSGCRSIQCTSGSSVLNVVACEKPDAGSKQYFEMYKQSPGLTSLKLCIGSACLQNEGYVKSTNYPMCFNVNSQNNSNQNTNSQPNTPVWLEPDGVSEVDSVDFHIQVYPMEDPENDFHVASDFEIWDVPNNQRVWSSLFNTVIKMHIHNADGNFENSLAGQNKLLFDRDYRVRARFYTNSTTNNISNWSEWRSFHTRAQQNFTNSTFEWTAKPGYTVEVVASDISTPVNIVIAPELYNHLPQGKRPKLYFTQLYGQVGMIRNDGSYAVFANNLLNYETFGSLPGSGETGVDGIYADPATGIIYVSMVYADSSSSTGFKGKVMKFFTNSSGDGYISSTTILSNIPVSPSHHVHLITRGPDGKLYMGVGDADNPSSAPDNTQLSGKILRFNDDGTMPSDNPVPGTYIYASGFRNPFGTTWNPSNNQMYMTENGPNSNDALKKVVPGFDHGWGASRGGNATAANALWLWKNTTAPVALAFNTGSSGFLSSESGSLFVALSGSTYSEGQSHNAKRILQFKMNSDGTVQTPTDFVVYTGNGYSAPIGMAFGKEGLYFTDFYGPDGFVGVGESDGRIMLIKPGMQTNNTNTTAEFSAGLGPQRWYPQGMDMVWVCRGIGGSGNYVYDFFFGDGNKRLNSASDNVFYRYAANGTYHASCTVRDLTTSKSASAFTTLVLGSTGSQSSQNGTITVNSNTASSDVFLNNVFKGTTSSSGNFVISNVAPGSYNIKVNKTGYSQFTSAITVSSGQNTVVNANLNSLNSTTCYSSLSSIPATCTSTITQDSMSGTCRTVECSDGTNSLRILACDKPDSGAKQYFEMYKQSTSGSGQEICLAGACISDAGYVKSANYPICS
jgi:glucose/arabinose dehydrogenase